MRATAWLWSWLALLVPVVCAGAMVSRRSAQPLSLHFANADDRAEVLAGKPLYMRYCASCHGRKLQGQPLWQLDDNGDGHRRAPAHDDTGHTWRHSDEDIFRMTKLGRFDGTPPGVTSYMPAFGATLSDQDILNVMAFIKARWSIGLRASQSMLNPGFAGMPASATGTQWTLPPTCAATQQRWRAVSR